jgi:predicted secreted Zn-dependent protease
MKVDVRWGSKNKNATYRVKGADLESAMKFLVGRDEWGSFDGPILWKWKGDAKGNVSSVIIEPSYAITMPTWPAYRNQPQECKDMWDTMWHALREHEDGHRESHRDIFERGVSRVVDKLEALEAATGGEIDDMMEKARSEIQGEHDAFDMKTDHGKSKGVELTISENCRSKPKGT